VKDYLDLLRWVYPHRWRFGTAMLALFVSMGFGLAFPWLMGRLLDAAIPSIKRLSDDAWRPSIGHVALVIMGTLAIQAVLTFFSSYSFTRVGEISVVQLRNAVYTRLISVPMEFFNRHRVGELTSRLSNDLAQIQEVLTFIFAALIRQTMMFAGGIVMIGITSWRLALVMISSFPLLIIVAVVMGRRIRRLSRAAQDQLAEGSTIVEETFQNISSVKAFTNESYETKRYATALDRFLAIILRGALHRAGLVTFVILGILGSIVLVMWQGARQLQAGLMTHGNLTTFMLYTVFVGGAVGSFAEIVSQLQKAIGATQRVREFLREPTELAVAEGSEAVPRLQGAVVFDDVCFVYPSRPDLPVLRGMSLRANPGERIALVGASGAGKSTAVSLLLRFYEPTEGAIRIDGKPASEFDLAQVRGNIAVVPQEVLLFGGTIRENIAYGRPSATKEQIRDAARRAHCEEFISRFPEGYETKVGERGVQLSGGQRQRIAIARAFLRDPAILILDEATSSLDAESESLIQAALETLLAGRTAIIIAHRLATVRRCDRIYVLQSGTVVEEGTHAELVAREGGIYRRLAELQFSN
jgi:ATP-binding cassette subfamily B protein